MIYAHVGQSPTEAIKDYAKVMKGVSPPIYSGEDDDLKFTTWLSEFLTYCRRLNITGSENEQGRVDLLGTVLKENAKEWLFHNVTSSGRQRVVWTFEDIIIALYQRFVVTDSFWQAEVNFHNIKWDDKRGPLGVAEDINRWASQMLEHPNEKMLRDKFMTSLPPKMEREIVKYHGLDPDFSPYQLWCETTIRIQKVEDDLQTRRSINTQIARKLQTTAASNATQPKTITAKSSSGRNSTFRPVAKDNPTTQSAVYVRKTAFIKKDANKAQGSFKPKTATTKPSYRTAQYSDKSKIDCYNCWEKGHMKKDCKNPTRPPPPGLKMYLMDIPEAEDEDMEEGGGEPPDSEEESLNAFEIQSDTEYERPTEEEPPTEAELRTLRIDTDESDNDEKDEDWLAFEWEHAEELEQMKILQSFQLQTDAPRNARNYWLYDPHVTRLMEDKDQPNRDIKMMQPITIEVELNGIPCYVLVDTGCNTNSFGPLTARIVKADRIDLKNQVQLQLGTKGSRTRINHGTRVNVKVGPVNESVYFDIVDIDRYDAILGMPFLTKHKVKMDMGTRSLTINGVNIPVYTAVEEAEIRKDREQRRRTAAAKYMLEVQANATED